MPLDEAALTQLLVREHDKLAAYTWALVRDDHLVDDILQEAALVAIRRRQEILDAQHFLRWMRVVCRLTALDSIKRLGKRPIILGDAVYELLDAEWSEQDATPASIVLEALRQCLGRLSPYGRKLIELRYGEGWKSAQIAASLKRDVQAIYVALTRVHRQLHECVERRLKEEAADG